MCAEAFNPDEDEEEKEPLVIIAFYKLSFLLQIQADSSERFDVSLLDSQVTHPKTDEQRQRLQEACRDILLFKNLDPVSAPRAATLYVAAPTLPFLIRMEHICLFPNLAGGDVAGAGRHV